MRQRAGSINIVCSMHTQGIAYMAGSRSGGLPDSSPQGKGRKGRWLRSQGASSASSLKRWRQENCLEFETNLRYVMSPRPA